MTISIQKVNECIEDRLVVLVLVVLVGLDVIVFLAVRKVKITICVDGGPRLPLSENEQQDCAGEHLHHAATATLRDVFPGNCLRRFRCGGAAPPCDRQLPRDAHR